MIQNLDLPLRGYGCSSALFSDYIIISCRSQLCLKCECRQCSEHTLAGQYLITSTSLFDYGPPWLATSSSPVYTTTHLFLQLTLPPPHPSLPPSLGTYVQKDNHTHTQWSTDIDISAATNHVWQSEKHWESLARPWSLITNKLNWPKPWQSERRVDHLMT